MEICSSFGVILGGGDKDLTDPKMLIKDNPYATSAQAGFESRVRKRNMDRLMQDAKNREGIHGKIYEGIKSMTLGG